MIFNGLLSRFTGDMGVDLGTANTLVYVRHEGIAFSASRLLMFPRSSATKSFGSRLQAA